MKKRNLHEIFSSLPAEKQKLPTLQNQTTISADVVQKRVMEKLGESTNTKPKRHTIHFRRITAAFIAAVILTSGTVLTVTAANGTLRQMLQTVFEKDVPYADQIENGLPEIQVTGENDAFTVSLMGVFGDEKAVTTILKLQGQNGFTWEEECDPFRMITLDMKNEESTSPSYYGKRWLCVDKNDSKNAYYIIQNGYVNPDGELPRSISVTFSDILKKDASRYTRAALQRWLGYSVAEQNQSGKRSFTAEEQEKLQEEFVLFDQEAYRKADVLYMGSVKVEIPLDYPTVESIPISLQEHVNMNLSPCSVHLHWEHTDMPNFIKAYEAKDGMRAGININHPITLSDGTEVSYDTFIRTETEIYPIDTVAWNLQDNCTSGDIWMTLQYPIDPKTITEIWYQGEPVYQK